MSVYVYLAKRSAIGKFKKSLANTSARIIANGVTKEMFKSIKPNTVDEVIVGNVLSAGNGQNIARQILIDSGISKSKCAYSVNMVCGSGLKAIDLAFRDIKLGKVNCVLAGGVENMSRAPMLKDRYDEEKPLVDHMVFDSLTDIFSLKHMGITAENIAKKYNVTREEQDEFSYLSQQKYQKAFEKGAFKDEIVPIITEEGNLFEVDEYPRSDTSIEKLSSLKPAFKKNGTVTAGNASGINDGAAFVIIGNEKVKEKPIVELVDFAEEGCNPNYMGLGPYYAINKLLKNNNLSINDIGLFEINEAFASQSIAVINLLSEKHKIDKNKFMEKINVNGGAVALGHPVGASGARVLVTLIHEMKKRKVKYGIASLCIGGGMGIAVLVKNVEE
jgi:acetyl-CoA C-acetyltransferase